MIEHYIDAYNAFDVQGMLETLHAEIEFSNVAKGEVNATASGIEAFRRLAERGKSLFASRKQTIRQFASSGDTASITVDFYGVLAVDLPDGPRKGDTITLVGRSTFRFRDGKLSEITDMS